MVKVALQAVHVVPKLVAGVVDVLAQEHSARREQRQQGLKGDALLVRLVAQLKK